MTQCPSTRNILHFEAGLGEARSLWPRWGRDESRLDNVPSHAKWPLLPPWWSFPIFHSSLKRRHSLGSSHEQFCDICVIFTKKKELYFKIMLSIAHLLQFQRGVWYLYFMLWGYRYIKFPNILNSLRGFLKRTLKLSVLCLHFISENFHSGVKCSQGCLCKFYQLFKLWIERYP